MNPRLQLAIMLVFNLAIVFEHINWSEIQISAVNGTLGVWLLLAREVFEKDLAKLGEAEAKAAAAVRVEPPMPPTNA